MAAWPHVELQDDQRGYQFKAVVLRDVAISSVNEGVNSLLRLIVQQPGLRSPQLAQMLGTSPKNVERWLRQLKQAEAVEFRGASKSGGYYPAV
jgi:hypothetical protein